MTEITTPLLGVNITDDKSSSRSVEAGVTLGWKVEGVDGTTYMAVKALSAITQYMTVGIDENFNAQPITKAMVDDAWRVGFAQTALTKGNYGWVALSGSNIKARTLASCAADVALWSSATAGVLDDASGSQSLIRGVVAVTAASAAATGGVNGQAVEVIASFPSAEAPQEVA